MALTGYKFPLEADPLTGDLVLVAGADYIRSQINSIVLTYKLERLGIPSLGVTYTVLNTVRYPELVAAEVRTLLDTYLPYAKYEVTASYDEGSGGILVLVYFTYEDTTDTVTVTVA